MNKQSGFQPLSGVRILDLSRVLAGAHGTAMLADLGAEVIKFELPEYGDDSRHLGAFDEEGASVYYALINRGKRSVTLDFKSQDDIQCFYQLVKDADVVVENFRPGVAKRLGIDFDTLKQYSPKLVYASISGFGQKGPLSKHPAYDIVAQAMSGLMSVTGFPETGPTRSGESLGDLCAGVYASWAVCAALFARERQPLQAQHIDVAMFDVLVSMQVTGLASLFANNKAPSLVGNRHPITTPFDAFQAVDGLVVIAVASDKLFTQLCVCMGQEALACDPRFINDSVRTQHEPELKVIIETWTQSQTVAALCECLLAVGVPASPLWDLKEATSSSQAQFRNLLIPVEAQNYPIVPQPVYFNGYKPHVTATAPKLGEANIFYGLKK